jgi:hypothetical protein
VKLFHVEDRVIFKPQLTGGLYYKAQATVREILETEDMEGIRLRRIEFDDGHSISVSVSELEPAQAESGGTA